MRLLPSGTKLEEKFDNIIEFSDSPITIRARIYNEYESWYVEGNNSWSFQFDNEVMRLTNQTYYGEPCTTIGNIEFTDIRNHLTKHINDFVLTIDPKLKQQVKLYINGNIIGGSKSIVNPPFPLHNWDTLMMHGNNHGKTIFDYILIDVGNIWGPDEVRQVYDTSPLVTDEYFIQFGFRNTVHDANIYSNITNVYIDTINFESFDRLNYIDNQIEHTCCMIISNNQLEKEFNELHSANIFSIRIKVRDEAIDDTISWMVRGLNKTQNPSEISWQFEQVNRNTMKLNDTEFDISNIPKYRVNDFILNKQYKFTEIVINGMSALKASSPVMYSWDKVVIENNNYNMLCLDLFEILVGKVWSYEYFNVLYPPHIKIEYNLVNGKHRWYFKLISNSFNSIRKLGFTLRFNVSNFDFGNLWNIISARPDGHDHISTITTSPAYRTGDFDFELNVFLEFNTNIQSNYTFITWNRCHNVFNKNVPSGPQEPIVCDLIYVNDTIVMPEHKEAIELRLGNHC